jgi:uncharacterized membrane protein
LRRLVLVPAGAAVLHFLDDLEQDKSTARAVARTGFDRRGLFSFGQAAFFGAGAYTAAILVVRVGISFAPVVFAVALGVSVVAGFVVGLLASRVRGMGSSW